MTPAEFAEIVVLPTVKDHLAARGDRRLAYLACIATYSLVDYLGRAEAGGVAASKIDAKKASIEVGRKIRSVCAPAYEVVQGICNGAKHAGSDQGRFPFAPGGEIFVPKARAGGICGRMRLGGPGLRIVHEGVKVYIDSAVRQVLKAFHETYPQHLGGVDLACLDVRLRQPFTSS